MLYYLTGMATERSAVLAYNLLHDGVVELGETAIAQTVIAPIRRQEPGHYAFYQLSARGLWTELAGWQRWMVRQLRSLSFAPVGANDAEQRADFGDMMRPCASPDPDDFAGQISRVERELLWAHRRGLRVPPYVARAFRDAVELAPAAPRPPDRPGRRQAQGPAGEPGDAVGGLGGTAGRLHDVAEHHPHHHVDGDVEVRAVQADVVRRERLGDHLLGDREQRVRVGREQREQLGVGAVGRGHDGMEQLVVLGELEHAVRRGADRVDQVVGVPVEGGGHHVEEAVSSRRITASASPSLEPTSL